MSDQSVNTGLSEKERAHIAQILSQTLADTYTLYLKTHAYHWNVVGPHFHTLHAMFQEQYHELWEAVDLIAERIRALGFPAPGSYRDFSSLTQIKESNGENNPPAALTMVENLVSDHELLARALRKAQSEASQLGDEATADILTHRLQSSEKTAWMLRSFLEKS